MRRRNLLGAALAAPLVVPLILPLLARAQQPFANVIIDGGPYVPTPNEVVARMLELAGVGPDDTLYDLGSGDGRLVIEAARRYGARGVGVEREARLVELARTAAASVGVADRVSFRQGDLFETDLRAATIVTLYLLPPLLERLLPKLRAELAPGARVVSHDFPLVPLAPERTLEFDSPEKAAVMLMPQTQLFLYRMRAAN
jgi:16S rRNA G966 N2-methylase RsmD